VGDIDQRHVETSRLKLDESQNQDDVDTDRSLTPVAVQAARTENLAKTEALRRSEPPHHDELEAPEPESESHWRLNALGAGLLTALLCCLLVVAGLKIKLNQTRAALAEAESAAEAAESAVAREPAEEPAERASELIPAPPLVAARAPIVAPLITDGPRPGTHAQLVLLLTVGTQHYAEKQVRALKHKCTAPLAVYRQKRGRCAYSQCFAVAVPYEEAGSAGGCGLMIDHPHLREKGSRVRASTVRPSRERE
jgi:hypothetical protein